ncbi:MAG: hypothetical protein R3C01_04425 [Planctomycetaceae bacterium]
MAKRSHDPDDDGDLDGFGENELPKRKQRGKKSDSISGRQAYNVVSDTVGGVNFRRSDNAFQCRFILFGIAIGSGVGLIVGSLWGGLSANEGKVWSQAGAGAIGGLLGGGFLGMVLGLLISGVWLGIYRAGEHARGKHD